MQIPASIKDHRQLIAEKLATDLITNPEAAAKTADLHYVSDRQPGFTRKPWGRGFSYFDSQGERVSESKLIERFKALNIPPAWQEVWICLDPKGHLQATGRDDKGRKQYRYHPEWRKLRSQAKFARLIPFGLSLPLIRKQYDSHLRKRKLTREKILAVVVRLLDETLIRVGNPQYARQNSSFGLTTLRNRHVEIFKHKVCFEFTGKSGIQHEIELRDRRLARAIKRCQEIPGYQLFQYFDDDGNKQQVDSGDVNQYLETITGHTFTAKEFRTWAGTMEAAIALQDVGNFQSDTEAKQNIVNAVKLVAKRLGNRPATCRKYYIHPLVLETYQAGQLLETLESIKTQVPSADELLELDELAMLSFLEQQKK
ncbi:DNA topoisomerase IB [Myxosarcina sp. GI1]|uniref:DNA topoisomerase IB n=1 Tax=Myxosarcina sp. GI1 TaxID=1541065 RepID=UPI00056AB695|nr:DNA topoisomerase IB [Myxosarcina sp. GI1]